MADFIIHHNGAYNIFGTIADGPHYASALTLDQLKELLQVQHGTRGMEQFDLRLERAHRTGCSGHDWTLNDCIAANRWTGDGEGSPGCMSREEFIRRYLTLPDGDGVLGRRCTWPECPCSTPNECQPETPSGVTPNGGERG